MNKLKLGAAAVFALLAVLVDFASKMMSIVADAALIGVAGVLVYSAIKSLKKG